MVISSRMLELPHVKYFEGTLQLRNPTEAVINWVLKTVKAERKALITEEKKVTGGIDMKFSSQRYLRALGKRLKERFTGELKFSRSLHTISKTTGKRLYRVTVMFRMLKYKKGDVLEIAGDKWQVTAIDKYVKVKNIGTGEKKQYKLNEIERYVR